MLSLKVRGYSVVMKYQILHVFRTYLATFKEKPPDHFKDLTKMSTPTNVDVDQTISQRSNKYCVQLPTH